LTVFIDLLTLICKNRIKESWSNIEGIFGGDIDKILDAMIVASEQE